METILLIVTLIICLYLLFTNIEFFFGFKKIFNLADQVNWNADKLPKLSIIFSALNEEKDIEKALNSLLQLNYPNYEIIAINDRSTDSTPDILNRYQKKYPSLLKVIHIEELPKHWLGKNHALHIGSQKSSGDWLLFTDADVLMKADILIKAISFALDKQIDHLTIHEHHVRQFFWLKVFYLSQYMTYSLLMKPWRIRYSWSKKSLGHGSFNLIRKQSYQGCGGHQAIAMECLDDLKFGQLVKQHQFKQDTVNGRDFIEREWYKSLNDMICGLKKNSFAFFNYQILPTIAAIIFAILLFLWPLIGAIFFSGWIQSLNIINVALTISMSTIVATEFRLNKTFAFLYPISISILIYTMINSMLSIYKNKGVMWRGTLYSLKELKK